MKLRRPRLSFSIASLLFLVAMSGMGTAYYTSRMENRRLNARVAGLEDQLNNAGIIVVRDPKKVYVMPLAGPGPGKWRFCIYIPHDYLLQITADPLRTTTFDLAPNRPQHAVELWCRGSAYGCGYRFRWPGVPNAGTQREYDPGEPIKLVNTPKGYSVVLRPTTEQDKAEREKEQKERKRMEQFFQATRARRLGVRRLLDERMQKN